MKLVVRLRASVKRAFVVMVILLVCVTTTALAVAMPAPSNSSAQMNLPSNNVSEELTSFEPANAPEARRAPAAASAPAPAVAPPMTHYTVRSGDTLSKIMLRQCGSGDWESLFLLNRSIIGDPNVIQADDVINLPCVPAPAPAPAAPAPVAEAPEPVVNAEPAAVLSGAGWTHPVPDATRCSDSFRWRNRHPVHGGGRMHNGTDIADGRAASPIVAASSGVVSFAGVKSGYGHTVIIEHDNDIYTMYAHAVEGSISVSEGQRVDVGDQIARVGSSGDVTGPHLHFEIQRGAMMQDRIDPEPFMAERGAPLC